MVLVIAGFGFGGLFLASRKTSTSPEAQAAPAQASQHQAAPVLAATAEAKDVLIIGRGIGSVLAFNTVTIKSRVDGNIVKVAFVEGQYVKIGDLLMQIDPRPFQAQIEQAEANKAKDQANLENARRDLARFAALLPSGLATTRQQYDTQKALVDQLTASVQPDQAQIGAPQNDLFVRRFADRRHYRVAARRYR